VGGFQDFDYEEFGFRIGISTSIANLINNQ
jgi:hypothetical protein